MQRHLARPVPWPRLLISSTLLECLVGNLDYVEKARMRIGMNRFELNYGQR